MSHNKMVMDNLIAVTGFFQMILESEPRGGRCGMRRPLALYLNNAQREASVGP